MVSTFFVEVVEDQEEEDWACLVLPVMMMILLVILVMKILLGDIWKEVEGEFSLLVADEVLLL